MGQPIVQVDAFTDRPFAGNPAAVCVLEQERDEAWMKDVAREMNLSETAFVRREGEVWRLRWFSPVAEVDLCGHATLATSHVLWEERYLRPEEELSFETRSGRLHARRRGERIELDFPATPATEGPAPAGLLEALGVRRAVAVARSRFDYLIELEDAAAVRDIAPDFAALRRIDARGVMLTARSDRAGSDFVSRFFAPAVGVDEDPVTGSAHCCLGPWWGARLGRDRLTGYQASARGGTVEVELAGERVLLRGSAVTVLRGELVA